MKFRNKIGSNDFSKVILDIPLPKSKEYKTISTLLEDAEKWKDVGDKDLESKIWLIISEKAKKYSENKSPLSCLIKGEDLITTYHRNKKPPKDRQG